MQDILDMAAKLGRAIADSPQARELAGAQKALDADEKLSKDLTDLRAQNARVAQLLREGKPVEVEDKHKVRELEARLAGSDVFKRYSKAQMEYSDLLRRVTQTVQNPPTAGNADRAG